MGIFSKIQYAGLFAASLTPLVSAVVPPVEGYAITWSDDFVGTVNSLPNTVEWTAQLGTAYPGGAPNWGTGEIQSFTSGTENVALDGNGNIGITARRDEAGAWTSARLETVKQDFTCAPGGKMRIQGSMQLPDLGEAGIGYWPAFWALGSNYRGNFQNWPAVGEIDVMENVNSQNKLWGTFHCGTNPGGVCNETDGLGNNTVPTGTPLQGNMHTYAMVVDRTDEAAEKMTWYLDDVQYHEVLQSALPAEVWAATVHNSYFVILNLAIGGSFPNKVFGAPTPVEGTVATGTFLIDYVAVYNSI